MFCLSKLRKPTESGTLMCIWCMGLHRYYITLLHNSAQLGVENFNQTLIASQYDQPEALLMAHGKRSQIIGTSDL